MGSGTLRFEIRTANGDLPVEGADILVSDGAGATLFRQTSNEGGLTDSITLNAPDGIFAQDPDYTGSVFGSYNVTVSAGGFRQVNIEGVQIFDGIDSVLPVILHPQTAAGTKALSESISILPNALKDPSPRHQVTESPNPRVLREVIIPDTIRVKLGRPDSHAVVVRVPFIDYIKNVASSEIYPNWPISSLEANILCQISLTLNRVYTEWYPGRNYNFDITNSTTVDQYYVHGRNIFDSVARIVDRIFNHYIRRTGFKEPYYAEYCNGTTATCPGLSQWGTVTLANQGYTPIDILKYYYPKDIEVVVCNRFAGIEESYPGYSLSVGSSGEYVHAMQLFLNRVSGDFPNIPRIQNANGIFGTDTRAAVQEFQRTFGLSPDGVIGRATWNYISRIYVAVKKMAQLVSEGQRIGVGNTPPTTTIRQGARGENVVLLQYLLSTIAEFYGSVSPPLQTGVFDTSTLQSVRDFQAEFGLTQDGVVGSGTWRTLYDVYKGIGGNVQIPPFGNQEYPGYALRRGSSGNAVKLIQNYLNAIGEVFTVIPKVTVDGMFGSATEAQVRAFQSIFGLTTDGIVGPSTWHSIIDQFNLLNVDTYPGTALRVGSRGEDVRKIQICLNIISTKYPSIPRLTEDGIFGNGTAAAVREFQRIFKLSQDGVVGLNTWNAIMREYRAIAMGQGTGRELGEGGSSEERQVEYISSVSYENVSYPGALIKIGENSDNVRIMQNYLAALSASYPIPKINTDGDFGQNTEDCVRAFQQLVGLDADGIIGQDTWKAISDSYWNLTNRDAMISAMGRAIVGKMFLG